MVCIKPVDTTHQIHDRDAPRFGREIALLRGQKFSLVLYLFDQSFRQINKPVPVLFIFLRGQTFIGRKQCGQTGNARHRVQHVVKKHPFQNSAALLGAYVL